MLKVPILPETYWLLTISVEIYLDLSNFTNIHHTQWTNITLLKLLKRIKNKGMGKYQNPASKSWQLVVFLFVSDCQRWGGCYKVSLSVSILVDHNDHATGSWPSLCSWLDSVLISSPRFIASYISLLTSHYHLTFESREIQKRF